MKTMKASDLRPGVQQVTTRAATSVKWNQDNTVHVEWSDGTSSIFQPDAGIEVTDA